MGIILVTGASSQIGDFLLPQLIAQGHQVIALSRQTRHPLQTTQLCWQKIDLNHLASDWQLPQIEIVFHLARLPLACDLLQHLPQVQRVIAFSSTSRFSKQDSSDAAEQTVAKMLSQAEYALEKMCITRQIAWTIFRPTLIYGCGKDKNVAFIAQLIQRFGFFPLAMPAQGLRQPVHAADLAQACLQALNEPKTYAKSYNLSGSETLTYREMVSRIFQALGKKRYVLPLPLRLLQFALFILRLLPRFRAVSSSMISRMNTDLCFSHAAAQRDFNYQPRGFIATSSHLGLTPKQP